MSPNVRAIVALISVAVAAPLALAPVANSAGRPSKVASVVEQFAAEVAAARRAARGGHDPRA
ncbi:MAG TPA: hypothetical protein VM266_00150, partial [Solirubrobacteraceae bacterium]|nr:hypothetical protein [Solirubrobacteraceae bacterium]